MICRKGKAHPGLLHMFPDTPICDKCMRMFLKYPVLQTFLSQEAKQVW